MLKLREWNEVLEYADKAAQELRDSGLKTITKTYNLYNGQKGIDLIIYDNGGNVFKSYSSGIHDSVKEYKKYIDYYKEKLMEESSPIKDDNASQIAEDIKWVLFDDRNFDLSLKFHSWTGNGNFFIVKDDDGNEYRVIVNKER